MSVPVNPKYPLFNNILNKNIKDLKKDINDIKNINIENAIKQEIENALKNVSIENIIKQEIENVVKDNILHLIKTDEKGFFIVDNDMNIGFCVNEDGAHSFNLVEHI